MAIYHQWVAIGGSTLGTLNSDIYRKKQKDSSHITCNDRQSTKYAMFGYMGISENSGTPKWMVYNGKPY